MTATLLSAWKSEEIESLMLAAPSLHEELLPETEASIGLSQAKTGTHINWSFTDWLAVVSPTWTWNWRHLVYIRQQLQRVTDGEVRRLMLSVPPQFGKSEQTTVRYPVYRLERDPKLRVAIAAYNQRHANRFSRKARRIAETRIKLSSDRTAVEEWETTTGGSVLAVGVGAGITGNPVDLLVIDDPVKSREEAESEVYRDNVWEWFTDDLYTRLQPNAAIILIMTRWHEDDLAGRILGSPQAPDWTVINLPAEAEEDDPLGRKPGELLCPERFNAAELADRKQVLGISYHGLYQGRPLPRGGLFFRREWFTKVIDAMPTGGAWIRWWDKAGTEGAGARTAGVLMHREEPGIFTVCDVVKGQWSSHHRNRVMQQTAERDGRNVQIWMEQEPGSGGKESAEFSIRQLAGYTVHAERSTGDKATRAQPFAAQCEAGNVRLLRAPWNGEYIDELCSFPRGKYKDQVDASSGGFNKLATIGGPWTLLRNQEAEDESLAAQMERAGI